MFKNFKVTTKLVAILVAPVLVLIALATVGVRQRLSDASTAERVQDLSTLAAEASDLMYQLGSESLYSAIYSVSGGAAGKADLDRQLAKTDEAVARFHARAPGFAQADSELDRGLRSFDPVAVRQLPVVRRTVTDRSHDAAGISNSYTTAIDALMVVVREAAKDVQDPELARLMTSYADYSDVSGPTLDLISRLGTAAQVGYFPAEMIKVGVPENKKGDMAGGCQGNLQQAENCKLFSSVVEAHNEALQILDLRFNRNATKDQKPIQRESVHSAFDSLVTTVVEEMTENNVAALISAEDYKAMAEAKIAKLKAAGDKILLSPNNAESVVSMADAKASQAQRQAYLYLFFAFASILAAGFITYAVGRSITVPLRQLTSAAYTLSTERLPALVERLRNPEDETHETLAATLTPINIDSKDEIGQLADSFNSIQQVTIEVAEEQSVLLRKGIGDIFINLARRNQTLLDRQIEFIDQLEANEEDPDQLDNLFKLDHLATRMRRNAESLLVLAGAEPPRRRGRPVALADVVRVAIGEVEDFARIQLLALDDATVGGNVAVDLAHLLSELMENATHFSPPDTMVEIVGHRSETGYIISVSDEGIGMSAEQLADANQQLARPPLVGLALSRSLGFIVIGRLAQRFGIAVKLTASPTGGVTALVTLPSDLVTYDSDDHMPGMAPVMPPPPAAAPTPAPPVATPPAPPVATPPAPSWSVPAAPEGRSPEPHRPSPGGDRDERPVSPPAFGAAATSSQFAPFDDPTATPAGEGDDFDRGLQEMLDREDSSGPAPTWWATPESDGPTDRPTDLPSSASTPEPPAERAEVAGPSWAVADVPSNPTPAPAASPAPPLVPSTPPVSVSPAPVRPEPIMTVAEQIAAASRIEAKNAGTTAAGLVKRTPKQRSDGATGGGMPAPNRATAASQRSPEEVRRMLSRYRSGLNKGRNGADPEKTES